VFDESYVVSSLLKICKPIGDFILQTGEVTKQMKGAKKGSGLATNFLKKVNQKKIKIKRTKEKQKSRMN